MAYGKQWHLELMVNDVINFDNDNLPWYLVKDLEWD